MFHVVSPVIGAISHIVYPKYVTNHLLHHLPYTDLYSYLNPLIRFEMDDAKENLLLGLTFRAQLVTHLYDRRMFINVEYIITQEVEYE